MDSLLHQVRGGNVRSIGRLISMVENSAELGRAAVKELYAETGRAHIIGVTGPPGSGKSTLVNELARGFSEQGRSVGIIAVDPSSPFTGGALLGDRVRMNDVAGLDGVFIRSMASRGVPGGLAQAASASIKILDVAGYDLILVETVGAGQAEVEIASVAHTVLVIEAPGSGDDIQADKAGILEVADILVVNKSDRLSAPNTVRALEAMLALGRSTPRVPSCDADEDGPDPWLVPVLQTIAIEGQGIDELINQIRAHRCYLQKSGEIVGRERRRSRLEIERLVRAGLLDRLGSDELWALQEALVAAVASRELDPYSAADRLIKGLNAGL